VKISFPFMMQRYELYLIYAILKWDYPH